MNTEKDRILSELLLVRYRRGESRAFDELVKHWHDRLFYYLMRLVSNEEDAWDSLQETWVALARDADRLREPSGVVMWLYKTARHKAMDRLRERYDDRTVSMECAEMPAEELDTVFFAVEDVELIHDALEQLPLCHREVLTLYFLRDLTMEEISQVLGIALGTVKSRLHNGKIALRLRLEKEGARVE